MQRSKRAVVDDRMHYDGRCVSVVIGERKSSSQLAQKMSSSASTAIETAAIESSTKMTSRYSESSKLILRLGVAAPSDAELEGV